MFGLKISCTALKTVFECDISCVCREICGSRVNCLKILDASACWELTVELKLRRIARNLYHVIPRGVISTMCLWSWITAVFATKKRAGN